MIKSIVQKYNTIKSLLVLYNKKLYFGFIQGHSHLNDEQVTSIEQLVGQKDDEVNRAFELEYAKLIGDGKGVSFAAGRMAFFTLMKVLEIGPGDEVILLGFTCSVMANAVLRTGATPIFTDVDSDTLGSSAAEIEKKISVNTKMIVAQHSFGIPCKIDEIVELGRRKKIFILEDCAITFDSEYKNTKVGNFGDAAIFSTDHSKPINTLIGGFLYTRNMELYYKVLNLQKSIPNLSSGHRKRLFKQLLWERKFYTPPRYANGIVVNILKNKMLKRNHTFTFLEADYSKYPSNEKLSYPYPAKLPSFLAQLGIYELNRWQEEKKRRIELLGRFKILSKELNIYQYLPKAYFDKRFDIVPLRFVFSHRNSELIKKKMLRYVDISWFWFQQPIIACIEPEEFGYSYGSCNISEMLGNEVINWPCVLDHKYNAQILNLFKEVFKDDSIRSRKN